MADVTSTTNANGPDAVSSSVANAFEDMARLEERMAALYERFARDLPGDRAFWRVMAREEQDHALWLRDCLAHARAGKMVVHEDRLPVSAVGRQHAIIDRFEAVLRQQTVTRALAGSMAMELEFGMIDGQCFVSLASDDSPLSAVLDRLAEHTFAHARKVREYWLRHCQGGPPDPTAPDDDQG